MVDRVAWKVSRRKADIASVRYRALLPMLALSEKNVSGAIYEREEVPDLGQISAIVFVKAFTFHDLALAEEARRRKIPVIVDVCDNIFVSGYGSDEYPEPSMIFTEMARLADVVTTTCEPLAEVLRSKVTAETIVVVIEDGIETPAERRRAGWLSYSNSVSRFLESPNVCIGNWFRLPQRIRRWLRWKRSRSVECQTREQGSKTYNNRAVERGRTSDKCQRAQIPSSSSLKRVLWFGNHGAPYASFGITDLLLVKDKLAQAFCKAPFELVVISNNRQKYEDLIAPFPFPTRYVSWRRKVVATWLKRSDVAIIPNSGDEFSRCKSANRALLSLYHGVPVVASRTKALEELGENAVFFDWDRGLERCLSDENSIRDSLGSIRSAITTRFSYAQLSRQWKDCIVRTVTQRSRDVTRHAGMSKAKALIVFVAIEQDIDVAVGLVAKLRPKSVLPIKLWIRAKLLDEHPRLWATLGALDEHPTPVLDDPVCLTQMLATEGCAVLAIAATSLRAHRAAEHVLKLASQLGLPTYAMQHGLENVGINYSDWRHPIKRVRFSAHRVFVWGGEESWHKDIPPKTREKFVSVGRPSGLSSTRRSIKETWPGQQVIGVFENLHWHRYGRVFRARFVDCLTATVQALPQTIFLVRSHHAGQWLVRRRQRLPSLPNIIFWDEAFGHAESQFLRSFISSFDAVVTTPSTVALDAAQANVPVAVVAGDLDVPLYDGLPLLRVLPDWLAFVETCGSSAKQDLLPRLGAFVNRNVVRGDSEQRILDMIVADTNISFVTKDFSPPPMPAADGAT